MIIQAVHDIIKHHDGYDSHGNHIPDTDRGA